MQIISEPISSNSFGKLKISSHDGHSLCVNGAQVSVLEQGNEVGFSWFLKSQHCWALEAEFLFELVSNFSDESLEGELSNEEISWFLVFSDFPQGNCSGFESVGLLDTSGNRGALSGNFLGNQLFSGHLLCGRLPCSLFCSSHSCIYYPFTSLYNVYRHKSAYIDGLFWLAQIYTAYFPPN